MKLKFLSLLTFQGRGESGCSATQMNRKCAPGLKCDEDFYCILDRSEFVAWPISFIFSGLFRFSLSASCLHTMHFDDLVSWKPNCEIDGSYASKSCRGDKLTGRCFCVGETGERIFGWDWWRNADDMTCSCSRQRHRAEMSGRLDVTLHCLPNGGFEELQCDMEICWCADENDGHILKGTMAVPKALWTYLPCCERHKNEM